MGSVLVADEHGHEVLTVQLSGTANQTVQACLDLSRNVARFKANFSAAVVRAVSRFPLPPAGALISRHRNTYLSHVHIAVVWVIAITAIVLAANIVPRRGILENASKTYSTASTSPKRGFVIAVRFAPQARLSGVEPVRGDGHPGHVSLELGDAERIIFPAMAQLPFRNAR